MIDRFFRTVFSLAGLSISVGCLGFMSSIVTLFIDVNKTLSVRWFLFASFVSVSLILVLLRIIYDLAREVKPPPPFERPIKYLDSDQVFIIKRNDNFVSNILLGCYVQNDDIDRLAYLGVVYLVQEKVIQIKIRSDYGLLARAPSTPDELRSIVIRPVVPITVLDQFSSPESI